MAKTEKKPMALSLLQLQIPGSDTENMQDLSDFIHAEKPTVCEQPELVYGPEPPHSRKHQIAPARCNPSRKALIKAFDSSYDSKPFDVTFNLEGHKISVQVTCLHYGGHGSPTKLFFEGLAVYGKARYNIKEEKGIAYKSYLTTNGVIGFYDTEKRSGWLQFVD